MFCARCSQPVGTSDRVCAQCGNDLLQSGEVRLTADIPGPGQDRPTPPDEWFTSTPGGRHGWSAGARPEPLATPGPGGPELGGPVPPTAPSEPVRPFRVPIGEPRSQATPVRRPVGASPVVLQPDEPRVVQPRRNRSLWAMVLVSVGLLAAVVPIAVVTLQLLNPPALDLGTPAPASSSPASPTPVASGAPGTTAASSAAPATTAPSSAASSSAPASFPAGTTVCAADVAAGPNTSCPFALNVAKVVDRAATGQWTVTATSPVTNQSYQMTCVRDQLITCTGGDNAVVHIIGR